MALQLSLLADGPVRVGAARPVRCPLDGRSWVDVAPGWLLGADDLYHRFCTALRWEQRSRMMFGAVVAEPRLTAALRVGTPGAPEPLGEIVDALRSEYGEALPHLWANWYRSGQDAVAWHADRVGRSRRHPLVAIVTLGGPRTFAVRRRGGGPARRWRLRSGDLLVMGGACQHDWEHTVPREQGGAPRISLTFRSRID